MIAAIVSLTFLGFSLGLALGLAARHFKVDADPMVEKIEAMLPGSQCGQCGFPGCSPAAVAVAAGEAPVTLCPPGGRALAQQLADVMGVTVDLSDAEDTEPMLARVNEETCIGCTKCFKVCPTDAIVGAPKQIHTVIEEACTGCGNCIGVCPTECLDMQPIETTLRSWRWPKPQPQLEAA